MHYKLFGPFVALLIANPALADEDFHCPKPGTTIVMSLDSGKEVSGTFDSQNGMMCRTHGNGKAYSSFLGLDAPGMSGAELSTNHAERLFPLKVGNEIEFKTQLDSSHIDHTVPGTSESYWLANTVKVVRQEKLQTRAGTFDTYVIEWHRQALGRVNGTWLITYWFAPELGYTVKASTETRAGYGSNSSFEITSLRISSPGQNPTAAQQDAPISDDPAVLCRHLKDSADLEISLSVCKSRGGIPENQPALASPPPTPAPTAAQNKPTPVPSSAADRLAALKDLLDRKLISPSEYESKRKAILDAL